MILFRPPPFARELHEPVWAQCADQKEECTKSARHHWSDWAGFAVFTFFWIETLRTTPAAGLITAPLVLHPLLSSAGFLLRRPLITSAPGFLPRFAGYGGTFGVMLFFLAARHLEPGWIAPTGNAHLTSMALALWVLGAAIDVYSVWSLRYAMSLVPQARTLITSGPYRLVRHPIYTAYILEMTALGLRFATVPMTIVVVLWFSVMLLRVRYEERVLESVFPEYSAYRRRAGMFWPRWQRPLAALPEKKSLVRAA